MIQDTPARPPLIGSKKKPLCGLKSERKQVVCAQKNPACKEESTKIQIFLRLPHTVSELFHSVPCLVCTGVFPFPGWYCV